MLFTHPELETLIDTDEPYLHTLVIENQMFFRRLLSDISDQISGYDGKAVLSINNKPVDFSKNAEIIDRFIPFNINQKPLISKITAALERNAVSPDHMQDTMRILTETESFLNDIAFDFSGDIIFNKLSAGTIIKSASPEIRCSGESLSEQIIEYMDLVTEFDRQKFYITVNLRSYISDHEYSLFGDTAMSHGYHILSIENREYTRIGCEKRVVVDADLCEIT